MKVDLAQDGLGMFFKPWQVPLMYKLLAENVELKTKEAHDIIRNAGFEISRASAIFFLQDMEEEGLLTYEEESGKGGMHKVYRRTKTLPSFLADIRAEVTQKILEYGKDELGQPI